MNDLSKFSLVFDIVVYDYSSLF